jgi:hypothetical protein
MTDKVIETIDVLAAEVMTRITQAASKHDLPSIETLTRAASELKEIKEKVLHVGARLARLNPQAANARGGLGTTSGGSKLREFKMEVTDGAIRQNLLTMTEPLKSGLAKAGEQFAIEALPSGERFKTILLTSGNKLQERGAINRFYRDAHVGGGDFVLLTEVAPGEWTLRKFSNGNGHV